MRHRIILTLTALFAFIMADLRTAQANEMDRRIDLQWLEVPGANGYELEIGEDTSFKAPLVGKKVPGTIFKLDLLPGAYYYRVRALDGRGFPGHWTIAHELFMNARPPTPITPKDKELIRGNLSDLGLPMEWKTSGPGVHYVIEIKKADAGGLFTNTLVKQETESIEYPFFPRDPGTYQWTLHTLGAGGDEAGVNWIFTVEGVVDRKNKKRRIVRYIGPWWRNHWTLYARYGQSMLSYSVTDMDLRARGSFSGITGYTNTLLNWEWHDPVSWTRGGIPWIEGEVQFGRQTVLSESIVLPSYAVRVGSWYDEWARNMRFSPIIEYGTHDIAIYQPRSSTEAVRSLPHRSWLGLGIGAEYEMESVLTLGLQLKLRFENGGLAGVTVKGATGDQLDTDRRAGNLLGSSGLEAILTGTMPLGAKLRLQGRLRFDRSTGSWVPLFPAAAVPGAPTGNTTFSAQYLSFDVGIGLKF